MNLFQIWKLTQRTSSIPSWETEERNRSTFHLRMIEWLHYHTLSLFGHHPQTTMIIFQ